MIHLYNTMFHQLSSVLIVENLDILHRERRERNIARLGTEFANPVTGKGTFKVCVE